jgi:acetoin utilization protein AcuB
MNVIDPIALTLSALMKSPVVSIGMDESLKAALDLCNSRRIRHLPVVDENKSLVGILTDRDIRYHLSPRLGTISENSSDRATLERRVHMVMVRNVITGIPDMTLATAAKTILRNRVGCLPVVDRDNRVVGIVTTSDFLILISSLEADLPGPPRLA